MKPVRFPKYFLLLLALGLMPVAGLRAADPEPAKPAPEMAPAPVALSAPTASVEPTGPAPAPAPPEGEMRELTAPEPGSGSEAAVKTSEDGSGRDAIRGRKPSRHRSGNNERISFGGDSTLAEGETAQAVVSIFGNSTSAGEVRDAVVSILGSSRVTGGQVGDAVVSVLGNTYINGEVRGEVVAVLGNVELGPKAVVHGEVVCVGGQVQRDPGAVVRGNVQNIAVAGRNFDFSGLTAWFTECLLQGRLLAFDARVMWAWTIALVALGFYALIALIAPTGVNKCVETLEQRPGYSLLAALLTLLLTPVVYILLALTITIVIGVVLIPLFSLGLFFASLFGKIVMLAWLGRRFTRLLGDGPLAQPVFGVLIGGVIMLLIYATPFVGFIAYKLLGILGLGVVVYTLILQAKASRPTKPAPVAPAGGRAAVSAAAFASAPVSVDPSGLASAPGNAAGMEPPPVSAAPAVISAATLPRAGFWLRIAATLLDAILIGMLGGFLSNMWSGFGVFPFWFAAYCVAMWATKGTTIGGIICGLKVVRLDDRPLDWGMAIVRGLGGFLSLAVAGLGFIWVAFDDERQSWHDKIAGTTIVKVPKGTALL